MSFLNKSINDLKLWWVCLSVHFCLFFIWNSRFCWSVFGFGSMSWKCTQCLIRQKKFSASVYSCFFLYFLVVGTESRFLFKSVKVSEESECFHKFITFPDGSDSYATLFLIACSILIVFPLFVG